MVKFTVTIKIDLRTRILSSHHNSYMIRSGKEYHLFDRFIERKAVAPDLPELDIPDGRAPLDDPTIDDQVKRARALRDWAMLPYYHGDPKPMEDLKFYEDEKKKSRHSMFVNTAQNVLWKIPEGSLIYAPSPSFLEDGLFGEVVSPSEKRVRFLGEKRMRDFSFQGRRMTNIRRLPMKKLPKHLLELKQYRVGVTQLRREDKLLLYPQYYGDFAIHDEHVQIEIKTTKDYFSPADAAIVSAFANMVQGNLDRFQQSSGDGQPHLSILEAAFVNWDDGRIQIHAEIESPGKIQIYGPTLAPLIFAAAISLFLDVPSHDIISHAEASDIVVTNSQSSSRLPPSGVDNSEVQRKLSSFLVRIGADDLERTIALVKAFNERTGGTVGTSVTQ